MELEKMNKQLMAELTAKTNDLMKSEINFDKIQKSYDLLHTDFKYVVHKF